MNKILLCFISLILLGACSSKKQKPVIANIPDHAINDTDKIFIAAEKRLQELATVKDSLRQYILLNDKFYDSAKKMKRPIIAGGFLDNIIHQHDQLVSDTTLKKILIKAYRETGYANYTIDRYNDTTIKNFEQFLLLTNETLDTHQSSFFACQFLGIQYHMLGDLKKCCYYYKQAGDHAKALQKIDWYASNTVDFTIALNELQLYDSAINLINTVLPEKGIEPKRLASLYVNLGEAQAGKYLLTESLNSTKKAIQILDNAQAQIDSNSLFEKRYNAFWTLGNIQLKAGDLVNAQVHLHEALQNYISFRKGDFKNREAGKLLLSIGYLAEAKNDLPQALLLYQKALACITSVDSNNVNQLPAQKELYPENTIMEALDAKAGVLEKMYSLSNDQSLLIQAVQCYELAFETERKLMLGFSYDESRLRQAYESKHRSEKAIAACYKLFSRTKSVLWAEKAFLFAEKSKGMVLQESVKRNVAANSSLQQDSNWIRVQYLQQSIIYYEKELAKIAVTDTTSTSRLNAQLNIAENSLLLANTALLHSNSSYREALLKTDDLSGKIIKDNLLDNKSALIEFFAGDSSTYMFLLTKKTAPVLLKLTDSLSSFTNTFLHFFTDKNVINNDPAAYQAAANTLYRHLGLSTIDTSAIKQLIIIPDGNLNFVPFEALTTKLTTAQAPKNFSYLIRQQQISYGYSAGTLLKQFEYKTASPSNIAAFSPVFSSGERGQTPLLNTLEELNAIKKEKPGGKYFIEKDAVLNNFKNNIASSGIIHIATHASADTSGGAQPVIQFYDSTLYLQELYSMHINAGLVVLSACETGIGTINKSEGAMSLARGFYYAGAKNIITSLWSVEDKSTASIFSHFYRHISGANYSLALYNAKLDYLNNASESNASPYYWAGFIHIGYEKPKEKNSSLIWICLAISIVILSLIILKKRK